MNSKAFHDDGMMLKLHTWTRTMPVLSRRGSLRVTFRLGWGL
jgi:hypothetical protein